MTSTADPLLFLQDVDRFFNAEGHIGVQALSAVTLGFAKGDFAVLSGPSGSGKTTLLNIAGGLDRPSGGEVILNGRCISSLAEKQLSLIRRNHIGFVFQAYNLIPVLTARENINYVMQIQGRTTEQCCTRTEEISRKLGLMDILEKLPGQLSGGQQQRVAVARAVAPHPDIILADEPTANLDSKNGENLIALLEQLNQDEDVTVLISSHDPMVIERGRHSIILKDGKVISENYQG